MGNKLSGTRESEIMSSPTGTKMDDLPMDLLRVILEHVDNKTLAVSCPRVCLKWYGLLSKNGFWLELCLQSDCVLPSRAMRQQHGDKFNYKKIYLKKPFSRNLVRNPSGEEGLKHWKMKDGGDGWAVEDIPVGADHDFTPCFATSYGLSTKRQKIDLLKEGFDAWILDELRPTIRVSENHAARWDCGAQYNFYPKLTDGQNGTLVEQHTGLMTEQWVGRAWSLAEHEFVDYPKGVRHVVHESHGSDTQFWAGHYGPKMANARVVIELE